MSESNTFHYLIEGDARELDFLEEESIHLAITSPPYWTLKRYNENDAQLGHVEDYRTFIGELEKVWKHCFRALVPGGRLIIVVGDVCLSRRKHGRHRVLPLHSDITRSCVNVGFDNLTPILWHKISNASYEVENGSQFLGKPFEPNGIIKNDMEFILMQRKPGGYRKPTQEQREKSKISKDNYYEWFQQIWRLPGATTKDHPAPYPEELAFRLINMFSFVGDIVLDPFVGTGSTSIAALKSDRNSVGVEIDPDYLDMAHERLKVEEQSLFNDYTIKLKSLEELQSVKVA